MSKSTNNFSVASLSVADLANLKRGISLVVDGMTRIDAENDNIKAEIEALENTLNVPGKLLKRLAKAKHTSSFDKQSEEFELFEELFNKV